MGVVQHSLSYIEYGISETKWSPKIKINCPAITESVIGKPLNTKKKNNKKKKEPKAKNNIATETILCFILNIIRSPSI